MGSARPVIFVAPNIRLGSARLRAVQICEEFNRRGLVSQVVPDDARVKGAILIYIKGNDVESIARARARDNLIVADLIDPHQKTFHMPGGPRLYFNEVDSALFDGALFVNSAMSEHGRRWSSRMSTAVIPHPWDSRFHQPPEHHAGISFLSLGHSGSRLVHPSITRIDLNNHVLTAAMIDQARKYACHVSLRDPTGEGSDERFGNATRRYQSKSNIKVSTAAACGANILASPDPGSLDVLPVDYPFWYDATRSLEEEIDRVEALFETSIWNEGLAMMTLVRERTSTGAVLEQYIRFLARL